MKKIIIITYYILCLIIGYWIGAFSGWLVEDKIGAVIVCMIFAYVIGDRIEKYLEKTFK